MAKEKSRSHINPNFLKLGIALVFTLGGIVFTFLRSKRVDKLSKVKPPLFSSGNSNHGDSSVEIGELMDNDCALQIVPLCSECHGDGSGFLSEFDQLLREPYETYGSKKWKSLVPEAKPPKDEEYGANEEYVREIRSLRNKVTLLEEREGILEIQLLLYYDLKEQETTFMELHNRLKLSNIESKIYRVQMESFHSENRILEVQVTDYAKVVAELESAKAKIKQLRTKVSSEAEQNREQILNLKERVMKLQDDEKKAIGFDRGFGIHLQKMKEMEEELEEVHKSNHSLKLENCKLTQKFKCVQMLATSVLDDDEITAIKEEGQHIGQQNDDLRKEIDQIQGDRCKDIEEFVYLRWINACLRYELRNYQPHTGKAVARDLSITLSPKSEEKAKQLILEYANKEGYGDKVFTITDSNFSSDRWSSQHTDSGEADHHSSKTKVFAMLMKLGKGKDRKHHTGTPILPLGVALSGDDTASRECTDVAGDGLMRQSGTSADDSLSVFRSFALINSYNDNPEPRIRSHQEAQNAAKAELMKYAEALKNSRTRVTSHQRSASPF